MSEKRRALGRGLGALIPSGTGTAERPVDVFFRDQDRPATPVAVPVAVGGHPPSPGARGTWPASSDGHLDGPRGGRPNPTICAVRRDARRSPALTRCHLVKVRA